MKTLFKIKSILFATIFTCTTAAGGPPVVVQKFSLTEILKDLKYGPSTMTGIPIRNKDDLEAGLLGVPNSVVTISNFEWPLTTFASSIDMTTIAFGLDGREFTGQNVNGKVVVVNLPENTTQAPAIEQIYDLSKFHNNLYVKDTFFINSHLLRIGATFEKNSQSTQQYTRNYWFVSTLENNILFNLLDVLVELNPVNVRAFSETIYIVESKSSTHNPNVHHVVHFNPLTQEFKTLLTIDGLSGSYLFHGPVDLPNRDVWRLGDDRLIIRYASPNKTRSEWEYHHLVIIGDKASIKDVRYPENQTMISGTTEYTYALRDDTLLVQTSSGETIRYTGDDGVTAGLQLEAFPGGFVGIEANWDLYRHYLLDLNGNATPILQDRLITADYHEGGFIGVSNVALRSHGQLILYRVIYNSQLLLNAEQKRIQRLLPNDPLAPVTFCTEIFR